MALFVWGMGKNGQLGNRQKENVEVPQRIPVAGKCTVVSVGAGGLYTGLVTSAGQVYCTGSGSHGRLATGKDEEATELQPATSLAGQTMTEISCGLWHGAAINDQGQLFVWGYAKKHGVIGVEVPRPLAEPTLLPIAQRIVGVSCGNNYTLAWTSEGELLSWGCGRHGVLGHGTEKDTLTPTSVKIPGPVAQADAGFAHSGFVTADGEVYLMGQGKDGALGLGKNKLDLALTPLRAKTPGGMVFKQVSCSKGEHHGHTLAVSSDGTLFSWGDGYKGKLGHGDQESRYDPTPLPSDAFNDEQVLQACAGGIHSSAVSVQGRVYTWGCGSDGRLGHPEAKGHRYLFRSDLPKVVEEVERYGHGLQVKASYYHTVAIVQPKAK